ncbi:molybdenum cofactor guanylyltransferase MobA [Hafnia paralvei]
MHDIEGVILAGGRASRMGGDDKGLVMLNGKPLYQYVLETLKPQVKTLSISTNRNLPIYQQSGLKVFSDTLRDYPGPLAGMLSGLQQSKHEWVMFAPCDVPFIPSDIVQYLWIHRAGHKAAYIHDGNRAHPTIALLNRALISPLMKYLEQGERKLMIFLEQCNAQQVTYLAQDCFINFNTHEECQRCEQKLKEQE